MALSSKEKSKIKMVALFGPGKQNIVWYSPLKQQKKPDQFIITGMIRRFLEQATSSGVKIIQFYANQAGTGTTLLEEVKVKS